MADQQPYIPQVGDWAKLVNGDGTDVRNGDGGPFIRGLVTALSPGGGPVIFVPNDPAPSAGWPLLDDEGERWVRMTPDEIALHCMEVDQ